MAKGKRKAKSGSDNKGLQAFIPDMLKGNTKWIVLALFFLAGCAFEAWSSGYIVFDTDVRSPSGAVWSPIGKVGAVLSGVQAVGDQQVAVPAACSRSPEGCSSTTSPPSATSHSASVQVGVMHGEDHQVTSLGQNLHDTVLPSEVATLDKQTTDITDVHIGPQASKAESLERSGNEESSASDQKISSPQDAQESEALSTDDGDQIKVRPEEHALSTESTAGNDSGGSRGFRVAVCIAGHWRDWGLAYPYIKKNIIDSLNADVFIVASFESDFKNQRFRGKGEEVDIAEMRKWFGPNFKGGTIQNVAGSSEVVDMLPPELQKAHADSRSSKTLPYLYKIWKCGQLMGSSGAQYDAAIRMRPDLIPLEKFSLSRVGDNDIQFDVGQTHIRLRERSVAIHAFTYHCGNDWFVIGSYKAIILTMDMLRFYTSESKWFSPDPSYDQHFKSQKGLEHLHDWLWWRTGTTVHRYPLYLEMARFKCFKEDCIRLSVFGPSKGSTKKRLLGKWKSWSDCTKKDGTDLDYFTQPNLADKVDCNHAIYADQPCGDKVKNLGWSRPKCEDIEDLSAANPLKPCKKITGMQTPAGQRHSIFVRHGYGVPRIFPGHGLKDMKF
eukprot:gnl/MRDRNA2_/MRDRNA2_76280_c0_seq1.p1 gnl/MRDRNA2_/MRDRNA2_76280_c0~~gnl/MRDRNA2_/MRDRNA2_76280_c0_seq1.p1  ORF type:complete len:609 (+),score=77.33 gnl/MRDRNA2_/MRDRNA2_76280_c0_seq1:79-1905(+)